MSTKEESPLVKLLKKSVGLPAGQSGCCGASAISAPGECCATTACCGTESSDDLSAGCCVAEPQAQEAKPSTAA